MRISDNQIEIQDTVWPGINNSTSSYVKYVRKAIVYNTINYEYPKRIEINEDKYDIIIYLWYREIVFYFISDKKQNLSSVNKEYIKQLLKVLVF